MAQEKLRRGTSSAQTDTDNGERRAQANAVVEIWEFVGIWKDLSRG